MNQTLAGRQYSPTPRGLYKDIRGQEPTQPKKRQGEMNTKKRTTKQKILLKNMKMKKVRR